MSQIQMQPRGCVLSLLAIASLFFASSAAAAGDIVQIKPRILILFDTSGSMTWHVDTDSILIRGDWSGDLWTGGRTCCPGLIANGTPRLYIAKNAMTKMLNASGDIDFALMHFAQDYSATQSGGFLNDFYQNNQNTSGNDRLRYRQSADWTKRSNWLSVGFAEGNTAEILMWMDHHEYSSGAHAGDPAYIGKPGYPALGQADSAPNPSWGMDPEDDGTKDGLEQELRASGSTPIDKAFIAARTYLAAFRAADIAADPLVGACRPYSVVLLTDGQADDQAAARAAIQNLYSDGIDTWVIGLSFKNPVLDELTADGGGHYDPTSGKAYYATSEDSLSEILYQVVAGSVMYETCNGQDDDCDGQTDEGVTNRCGQCGNDPTEICDGVDNDCDGLTDEDVGYLDEHPGDSTNACSRAPGGQTAEQGICEPGIWQCNGVAAWVCLGGVGPIAADACDGLDNDCDGLTDEHASWLAENGVGDTDDLCSATPFAGVGECDFGRYACSSGRWSCRDYLEPMLEGVSCDGLDNDCDGLVDEAISQPCGGGPAGHENDGICRVGARYCDGELPEWQTECSGNVDPQSAERCNGQDDNCNGQDDEGLTVAVHAWLGQSCGGATSGNPNEGACRQGAYVCKDGQQKCCVGSAATCTDAVSPTTEATLGCDNVDNDCDGQTDENLRSECWVGMDAGAARPNNFGQCLIGWRTCSPGLAEWGLCQGSIGATFELCDGLDNDCDGATDEGIVGLGKCGGAPTGNPDAGECQSGQLTCESGALVCTGSPVGPASETCDNKDNDCDGLADEGVFQTCWDEAYPAIGICHSGVKTCAAGVWGACMGSIVKQAQELCNGLDDDCDGVTDEASALEPYGDVIGEQCNNCGDVWQCRLPEGVPYCPTDHSNAEECDGDDNDCDGLTDEDVSLPCGGCDGLGSVNTTCGGAAGAEEGQCRQGLRYCDSSIALPGYPEWTACIGAIGPAQEVCDGEDNNCDGMTDEESSIPLIGLECARAIGQCESGTLRCAKDSASDTRLVCCKEVTADGVCVPPVGPMDEVCNGFDDNCNGVPDENVFKPCGGADTDGCASLPGEICPDGNSQGECQPGAQRCEALLGAGMATWGICQGAIGKAAELCDGLDNNCDGETDEDVVFEEPACSRSATANSDEGACRAGAWTCEDSKPVCTGGIGPMAETCNGADDDCDGVTDEEITEVGGPCGKAIGVCTQGATACVCAGSACSLTCQGMYAGTTESCNGLDDDCDGETDEGVALGAACVNSPDGVTPVGDCTEGHLQCVAGTWICNGPQSGVELCDGKDNNCDGLTDNNAKCPLGSVCVEGECSAPCQLNGEMSCPAGKACVEVTLDGETFGTCLTDICTPGVQNALPCAENPYYCSADHKPPCVCSEVAEACVNPCELKTCPAGKVCVASELNGQGLAVCQPLDETCWTKGCATGSICTSGQCQDDPCAGVNCKAGEYCNSAGSCVAPCVDLQCPKGCFEGKCVADPCAGVVCLAGYSCDSATGACERGKCFGMACAFYQVCADGACVDDPCWNVRCPNGLECVNGACYAYTKPGSQPDTDSADTAPADAGVDSGDTPTVVPVDTSELDRDHEVEKVLASGAGGCLCTNAPGTPKDPERALWPLAVLLLFALFARSRQKLGVVTLVSGVALTALLLGCEVQPFDLTGGIEDTTSGQSTSSVDSDSSTSATSTETGSTGTSSATCDTADADDNCDGMDDNCDGRTDEGVDTASNAVHCGGCGKACAYPHAISKCLSGKCAMADCAPYWYDRNQSDTDGCESMCQPTVPDVPGADRCDGEDRNDPLNPYQGSDNDCDGVTDEDANLEGDPANCGRCGNVCRFAGAVAECAQADCAMGTCNANFLDLNQSDTDGCEYLCRPSDGGQGLGVEACDRKDNDCDGVTDEDEVDTEWGAQGGGSCYVEDSTDPACVPNGETFDCRNVCAAGTWKCENGTLRCKGQTTPEPLEACDNLDNDCDGVTDEEEQIPLVGADDGALCGSAVGDCEQGRMRCAKSNATAAQNMEICCKDVDTSGVCVRPDAEEPGDEVSCDGRDNDCDNLIDESPTDPNGKLTNGPCYYSQAFGGPPPVGLFGKCVSEVGVWTCYYSTWLCDGASGPAIESCNNIDDSCDGHTDEGLYQTCHAGSYLESGLCRYGLQKCTAGAWGACSNEIGPNPELCDGLDNDCDGVTDEADGVAAGDDRIGTTCNIGVCAGARICEGGKIVCGGVDFSLVETPCNKKDDDCDGTTDELDSYLCGGCDGSDSVNPACALGGEEGRCQQGTWSCESGSPQCQGEIGPEGETCDHLDNDCDGVTDESASGQPLTNGACGSCGDGTVTCVAGAFSCVGATVPSADVCDGEDNDCNQGTPDGVAQTWYGEPCDGPDADQCPEGIRECQETSPGVFGQVCSDHTGDSIEECNGIDDNCDGQIDEGLSAPAGVCNANCPGGGTPRCGAVGWYCDYLCDNEVGGHVQCDGSGYPLPVETLCDGYDNDCDGQTDETFDTGFDVSNCGGCRNDCAADGALWSRNGNLVPPHAQIGCVNGACILLSCETGYVDDLANGYQDCGYLCTPSNGGVEVCDHKDNDCDGQTDEVVNEETCNGFDDNCDGQTDEDVTPPLGTCKAQGVCAVLMPTCSAGVWNCHYDTLGATYLADGELCDRLDNDCDGVTDEGLNFSLYATRCEVGVGACQKQGAYRCSADGAAVVCCDSSNAATKCDAGKVLVASSAVAEVCDGADNDCDGQTDEQIAVGAGSGLEYASLGSGATAFDIFVFEASRPDAQAYDTDTSAENGGVLGNAACSADGKVPWTMVDYGTARTACRALNEPTRDCATQPCWDLCTKEQWEIACADGGGTASSSYPYGDVYNGGTCNGHDYSAQWDHSLGAGDAATCVADWAVDLFDLSGNVEEWTSSSRLLGNNFLYEIRGGSYNDQAGGLTCDFDFWAARSDFAMPNLGFRCCRSLNAAAWQCDQALATVAHLPYDFEGQGCSTGGWTVTPDWEAGVFNGECVLGTNVEGDYTPNHNTVDAMSPIMNLFACKDQPLTLQFDMAYNIEPGSAGTCGNDWVDLQVYNGTGWVTVATDLGYDYSNSWCGTSGGTWPSAPVWEHHTVNLSSYANSTLRLRFRLKSNASIQEEGAYIDNVKITPY